MTEGTQNPTADALSPAQRHIIKRPRLTKLLDEADARVILLVAPAGYGKTTLAREWVSTGARESFWCQLGPEAADPAALAIRLAEALTAHFPRLPDLVHSYLAASPNPDPIVLANLLADEVVPWPKNAWLILDDYNVVAGIPTCEELISSLSDRSGAFLLLSSRERPSWISTRALLYGDAVEIGRDALAMSTKESQEVLSHFEEVPAGLVSLADGWPAVLGLAALLPEGFQLGQELPDHIYEYLAQELFEALDVSVQAHLALLAIPRSLDAAIAKALLGNDAEKALDEGLRVGLLSSTKDSAFEMHPLARAFLHRKLHVLEPPRVALRRLLAQLRSHTRWDDAFTLLEQFELVDEFPGFLRAALSDSISQGRLTTIERWLAWADRRSLEAPELSLARAELCLRRGECAAAESLALASAELLDSASLAADAYLCAGRAANLLDNSELADACFDRALVESASQSTRRQGLWGKFTSAAQRQPQDQAAALAALEASPDASPDHLLRVTHARLMMASRHSNIADAAELALASDALLAAVMDPFVRTGFLNTLANALVLAGRYHKAEEVATLELQEGERFRLDFVARAGMLNLAGAKLGTGAFTAAVVLVDKAEAKDSSGDRYHRANCAANRARIELSRRDYDAALEAFASLRFEGARPDILGEVWATLALAQACRGDLRAAQEALGHAARLNDLIDTRVLAAAAEAILSQGSKTKFGLSLEKLSTEVSITGNIDGAVCALRAHPTFLEGAAGHPAGRNLVRNAAIASGDPTLSALVGIKRSKRDPVTPPLSARELEVLSLAAEGLTNDEIGQRLFISSKTVKTHLQNMFEKMGVRSRTEAAMKAKEAGLLNRGHSGRS